MPSKKIFFGAAVLCVLLSGCGRTAADKTKVIRLIDLLNQAGIRHSPFLEKSTFGNIAQPSKSRPLLECRAEENPFLLKKKLNTGGAEINVLFSPPRSEYAFDITLPSQAKLEFGAGILAEEAPEKIKQQPGKPRQGVNFRIILESGGRKKTLFQKFISLPKSEEGQNISFSLHQIELPSRAKATLSLATDGGQGIFSFWYNPVIYVASEKTKQVILISIDTLRADHLGCYGYPRETSPRIDALAADSALFVNTYASSPWTLPSHVSLLTGLDNVHHQVYLDNELMAPEMQTLAEILRKNQFFCSAFTGGGFVSGFYGFSKGFDSYREGEGSVFHQDSAEKVFRVASEWLERNKDRNFFLFLHTYQPHTPYACPYPYKTMFAGENPEWRHIDIISHLGGKNGIFKALTEEQRRNIIALYDGEIRYTDEALIGPLVDRLKKMGLYDQSLLIFLSDHGEEFFDHGAWGHGHSLYDESLKVPLLIKFPGFKHKGRRIGQYVRLVDVMPTILEELGIEPSGMDLDGRSLFSLLTGKEKMDRTFLADIGNNVMNSHIPQKVTTNSGRKKLILNKPFNEEDLHFFSFPPPLPPRFEVYDLDRDPLEKRPVESDMAAMVRQLTRQIDRIYKEAKKRNVGKAELDELLREQLRALGYIQ